MIELWESMFIENQMMWGFQPADSAVLTKDFFLKNKINDILIPDIGYGRNSKVFTQNGINVTGIEISETGIDLARKNGLDIDIVHGSVADMPFDDKLYDGIFCYALIHLLNKNERDKFIKDCYNQLKAGGYMIFTTVSKKAPMYGRGKQLGQNYFEVNKGMKMFFYDSDSVKEELGKYGLIEFSEILEPLTFEFIIVICQK